MQRSTFGDPCSIFCGLILGLLLASTTLAAPTNLLMFGQEGSGTNGLTLAAILRTKAAIQPPGSPRRGRRPAHAQGDAVIGVGPRSVDTPQRPNDRDRIVTCEFLIWRALKRATFRASWTPPNAETIGIGS